MKTKSTLIILAITVILMEGCASSKHWVDVPTSDQYTIYARGLSNGIRDEAESEDDALLRANTRMAGMIETHIKSLNKRAYEQVGIGKDSELNRIYSNAVKATVDQTLTMVLVHDGPVTKGNMRKGYRSEITLKMDLGPVNESMVENVKKRQKLYERFRTSELFKEMEDEINNKKYPASSPE